MQIIQFDAGPFFEETINTNEHYNQGVYFYENQVNIKLVDV